MADSGSKPGATRERSYSGGYMDAGKKAEDLFAEVVRGRGFKVTDVRDDLDYQMKDIDFLLIKDGRQYSVEVKSDKWLDVRGNFVFEMLRINHTTEQEHRFKVGWSIYSHATSVAFYAPSSHRFHILSMQDYRAAANEAFAALRQDVLIILVPTDAIKSTLTALLPVEFLFKQPSYRRFEVTEE